jgi:tetratricopeptide (TPR) repeat protein
MANHPQEPSSSADSIAPQDADDHAAETPTKRRRYLKPILLLIVVSQLALAWWGLQPADYWGKAQAALQRGEHKTAKIHLMNHLQVAPEDGNAHLVFARLLIDLAKTEDRTATFATHSQAFAELRRAAKLLPENLAVQIELLDVLLELKLIDEAEGVAQRIVLIDPKHEEAQYLVAANALKREKYEAAQTAINQLLTFSATPRFRVLRLQSALAHATSDQQKLWSVLVRSVESMAAINPDEWAELDNDDRRASLELVLLLGELSDSERPDDAEHLREVMETTVTALEKAVGFKGLESGRLAQISHCGIRIVSWQSAETPVERSESSSTKQHELESRVLRLVDHAVAAQETDPSLYHATALLALRRGDEEKAHNMVQLGLDSPAGLPEAKRRELLPLHLLSAELLVARGEPDAAREHLALLFDDPDHQGSAHIIAGNIAFRGGMLETALEHHRKARHMLRGTASLVPLVTTLLALQRWSDALPYLAALHKTYVHAEEAEREWIQQHLGGVADLRYLQAKCYLVLNHSEEAARLLNELKETGHLQQAVQLAFAHHTFRPQARSMFGSLQELREQFPDDFALLTIETAELAAQDKFTEVEQLLRTHVKRNPEDLHGSLTLVRWLASQGRHAEALAQINELTPSLAGQPLAQLHRAELLLLMGNTAESWRIANDLRKRDRSLIAGAATLLAVKVALNRQNDDEVSQILKGDERPQPKSEKVEKESTESRAQNLFVREMIHLVPVSGLRTLSRELLARSLSSIAIQVSPQEMEGLFDNLLKDFPYEPVLLRARADFALRQGEPAQAIRVLNALSLLQPNLAMPHYLKAQVWLLHGQPAEALAELDRALKVQPEHAQSHLLAAEYYLQSGDFDKARKSAEAAANYEPTLERAYLVEAEAYVQQYSPLKATLTLRRLLGRMPKSTSGYTALISAYASAGMFSKAFATLEQGRQELGDDVELRLSEVSLHCRNGDIAGAEKAAEGVPDAQRNVAECIKLGTVFQGAGQYELAREWTLRAAENAAAEQLELANFQLGVIDGLQYQETKNSEQLASACEHFRNVLKINPQHLDAGNNLAWLLATELEREDEALEVIQRVRGDVPLHRLTVDFVDTLLTIYRKVGHLGEARRLAEQAVALRPRDENLQRQLKLVEESLRMQQSASDQLQKELIPNKKAAETLAE